MKCGVWENSFLIGIRRLGRVIGFMRILTFGIY